MLTKPAGCALQTLGGLFLLGIGPLTFVTLVGSHDSFWWGIPGLLLAAFGMLLLVWGRQPAVRP